MNPLLILPIIVPLVSAALCLVAWRWRHVQRAIGVFASLIHFVLSLSLLLNVDQLGIQAAQIGGWPAPFGITIVADLFSAIMLTLASFVAAGVAVYSLWSMDEQRERFGYYVFYQVLVMGVSGAFLTGDIFNLYVWFEVMLMASFVLLALGGERPQLEGSIKYVTLNLISSAFFLSAVGLLYGVMGTLNMADLSVKMSDEMPVGLATTLAMLFLVAFGIKAAVFPLFFWLPASYHTPPAAVSAVFAGLLTKVGVYALIRVFTLIFTQDVGYTHTIILVIAGFTMVTGVLGAAAQHEFRRILAFHKVSQIGYIIMGLGLFTRSALAATVFYLMHYIIVKSNLFLVSGVVRHVRGSYELDELGGLYKSRPYLAALFMISAMSLAGLPPFSGFFAKFSLIVAGVESESYIMVAVALLVSILTLFSMTKIWAAVFWRPAPSENPPAPEVSKAAVRGMMGPIVVMAAMILVIGFGAELFYGLAMRASEQLMNPSMYYEAVMGGAP